MTKPDEWMPLHIGKYLADTVHLSREEHGAYLLLLMAYWSNGGPILADDKRLAAIAKATPAEWRKLKPVLGEFFREDDGRWHQKRADAELAKAKAYQEAKAKAGQKGAESRWQTHGSRMADASNSHRQTDAPLPSPEVTETPSLRSGVSRAPRKKPGTALPEGSPTEAERAKAVAYWGSISRMDLAEFVDIEADNFRDHHLKLGTIFSDWEAAWRFWYRNTPQKRKANEHAGRQPSAHDRHLAGLALLIEERS